MNDGKAKYGRTDGDVVVCELCPHYCRLKDGQRGVCYVRQNSGGVLYNTTYGINSGLAVDPIEKKPLNHFLPGSDVLSFGTAGCNLSCAFCQNWTLSRARDTEERGVQAAPEKIVKTALRAGCRSVAFTYNEPIIFFEYAMDTADACHAAGVKTVAVTAGYINEKPRAEFFSRLDAANIDLKAFTDDFYRRLCKAHLGPVLDTIEYAVNQTDCWVELTTLLIPGENDGDDEINAMTRWIVEHCGPDVPLHFTAFHPDYKMADHQPTPVKTLLRARAQARANGMNYVYTGNVVHPESASTWCPACGAELIRRAGYATEIVGLTADGRCNTCGRACPGRF